MADSTPITPEVMQRCDFPVKMHDDRFGIITLRCQKNPGHFSSRSPHEHAMGACDPMAILVWGE